MSPINPMAVVAAVIIAVLAGAFARQLATAAPGARA
jgi:hypothetical protein